MKPGEESIVVEFAGFNSITKTREMTTTSIKSKTIGVKQSTSESSHAGNVHEPAGYIGFRANTFVFGAGQHLHPFASGGSGSGTEYGQKVFTCQSGMVDAVRMSVMSPGNQHQRVVPGSTTVETGDIMLAPTTGNIELSGGLKVNPIKEYYENSDSDQYVDMESIENSEVSFTTKLIP